MANETLTGFQSSHAVYINRLASHEVNELNKFWGAYLAELQKAVSTYSDTMTQKQLDKLIARIEKIITANSEELSSQIEMALGEFAEYEGDFQAKGLSSILGETLVVPTAEVVISVATQRPMQFNNGAMTMADWFDDITTKQKQMISNELKLGYANGVTLNDMVQRIVGTKANNFTDGIANIGRRDAETLTRTAYNNFASVARHQVYGSVSDVIKGYRIIATLDIHTSVTCRDLDQNEYYYDEEGEKPKPPFHPRCRTVDVPITKGEERVIGTRSSKGATLNDKGDLVSDPKQVSGSLQYYEFLKRQPAAYQDQVLGKTRGKIFRNSGITVDKFKSLMTDRMNQPLTLAEMAQKDAKVREYMRTL